MGEYIKKKLDSINSPSRIKNQIKILLMFIGF